MLYYLFYLTFTGRIKLSRERVSLNVFVAFENHARKLRLAGFG